MFVKITEIINYKLLVDFLKLRDVDTMVEGVRVDGKCVESVWKGWILLFMAVPSHFKVIIALSLFHTIN